MAINKIRILLPTLLIVLIIVLGIWALSSSPRFQLFGTLVNRVDTNEKVIALTFDDGPTKDYSQNIITILDEANIKATFYLIGSHLKQNPQQAKQLINAGHEIGNHSWSHQHMILKSQTMIDKEIQQTNALIRQYGYRGDIHFRPPYGKKLFALPYYLSQKQITTITWDIAPESNKTIARHSRSISDHVVENAQPGSIILLHVMNRYRSTSMAAVPDIIRRLKAAGYRFVTVSELLTYHN